jgi:hypothetical protein
MRKLLRRTKAVKPVRIANLSSRAGVPAMLFAPLDKLAGCDVGQTRKTQAFCDILAACETLGTPVSSWP